MLPHLQVTNIHENYNDYGKPKYDIFNFSHYYYQETNYYINKLPCLLLCDKSSGNHAMRSTYNSHVAVN